VHAIGGAMSDFVIMQVCGVGIFMLAANSVGRLVDRFGAERMISTGSTLAAVGSCALLAYGMAGGRSGVLVALLFMLVGAGLGLRGPPGFFRAVIAARGDDARGAALVILFILGIAAISTALVAPLLLGGLAPVAGIAFGLHLLALLCLWLLPALRDPAPAE
jgi:hypothetical protein